MSSVDVHDPRIGMVLQERYRVLRKLGDGGMGSVYEGEHLVIKRRVALKILHSRFAESPEIVARFQREAEAATAIGHPNIVEVTDMGGCPDGAAFMVLELLNGRDFARDIQREGPQPIGKVVHVVSQVCDALEAAHGKGIVHRDLKPENVFLLERGGDPHFAKVLDFGISKIVDTGVENRSLTQTGTALGTPYYMAPEQCQGRKDVDARADIYALGVIVFRALTGQYPFDDEAYPMLVLKICTEAPPPLEQYRSDLPHELCAIVQRMLAKHREHRFASCAEVKAALAPFRHVDTPPVVLDAPSTASRGPAVLEGHAPASSPPPASAPAPMAEVASASSSGRLAALIAVFAVLGLAGGVLGVVLALRAANGGDRASDARRTARSAEPRSEVRSGAPSNGEPSTDELVSGEAGIHQPSSDAPTSRAAGRRPPTRRAATSRAPTHRARRSRAPRNRRPSTRRSPRSSR